MATPLDMNAVAAGLGFVGVFVGSGLTWAMQRASERRKEHLEAEREAAAAAARRIDETWRLYDFWDSIPMNAARSLAWDAVLAAPTTRISVLVKQVSAAHADAIWQVLHFYQRLRRLTADGRLDSTRAAAWFGESFYGWYGQCFAHQVIQEPYEAVRDIQELRAWMDAHTAPADRARWVATTDATRADALAAFAARESAPPLPPGTPAPVGALPDAGAAAAAGAALYTGVGTAAGDLKDARSPAPAGTVDPRSATGAP